MEQRATTHHVHKLSFILLILSLAFPSSSFELRPSVADSTFLHSNDTAISDFRVLNRRALFQCPDLNPYLQINVTTQGDLSDEQFITVNVSGVLVPSDGDWVAMVSPSFSNVTTCLGSEAYYLQTGDTSILPLLCHYPVKAKYVTSDPSYLSCKNQKCQKYGNNGDCEVRTCAGSLSFHVVNIRTNIEFVFFAGGFSTPCILTKTDVPLKFSNPNSPLHGHLSSIDSTATSMRLTWVSGDKEPQQVQYGDGKSQTSEVTTFSAADMCSSIVVPSPAKDFGWHDPGYIHTAVMSGLQPSSTFNYKYGSDAVGWSAEIQFRTPPAGGSDELKFIVFGDMGKAPLDSSAEHYIQPGSISVIKGMTEEVENGNVDSIFHIGDISYATGFLVEWDYFLNLITPLASKVSYMTAIGNHERDYSDSGSWYTGPDSGGECGVPYETYFPMPTPAKDKPWYSIEQGSVHFTVISTEHDWTEKSEQYEWMKTDMASVDRSKTPWLVFTGHRPMYSSLGADDQFLETVEPLLLNNKVDLVLFGHVHNYERTCSIYNSECLAIPEKDKNGIDTYDNTNYSAPVQAIVGMAGFSLEKFPDDFVNSDTKNVDDSFIITKK
ncbi:hypothetical protein V6Z11_A13G014100 [Gossypium hirsutum]